jgi:hypothetical protein
MSSRVANRIKDSINTQFASIGHDKATSPPKVQSNLAPIAWEYYAAQHLKALASGRFKQACSLAIRSKIIFDHERYPKPPGTNDLIYNGDQIGIWVEVRSPGMRVDVDKLLAYLEAQGNVPREVLDKARIEATLPNKAAHVFRSSINTNDDRA